MIQETIKAFAIRKSDKKEKKKDQKIYVKTKI